MIGTRPRLIASDLDGTFLSPDGTVSEVNAAAVEHAASLGVPFVFATGRPSRWLACLDEVSQAHPLVIVSNGAGVFDLATHELTQVRAIAPDLVVDLTDRIRSALPGIAFGLEFPSGFAREPAIPEDPDGVFSAMGEVPDLVVAGDVMKILVFTYDLGSEELSHHVRRLAEDTVEVTYSAKSDYGFVEVMAAGVSKASSLEGLCRSFGIERADVAAFGDMPNDIELLDWAGLPYRMEQCDPILQERGYGIAGSNAASGVGRTVLELLGTAHPDAVSPGRDEPRIAAR
jgi:Cof subfamily protein (haloacid dehalogenase superfamily)